LADFPEIEMELVELGEVLVDPAGNYHLGNQLPAAVED